MYSRSGRLIQIVQNGELSIIFGTIRNIWRFPAPPQPCPRSVTPRCSCLPWFPAPRARASSRARIPPGTRPALSAVRCGCVCGRAPYDGTRPEQQRQCRIMRISMARQFFVLRARSCLRIPRRGGCNRATIRARAREGNGDQDDQRLDRRTAIDERHDERDQEPERRFARDRSEYL